MPQPTETQTKLVKAPPKLIAAIKYAENTLRHGTPTRETIDCVTYLQATLAQFGKRIIP